MAAVISPISPSPRHILVRGVNWLGDAVMTTPALQRLRERFPRAQISILTHEKLADLWQHHPSIDHVIPFSAEESVWSVARTARAWHFQHGLMETQDFNSMPGAAEPVKPPGSAPDEIAEKFVKVLGHSGIGPHPFDLGLILPNSPRAALETWAIRIPRRVGYARPWRNWLLTHPVLARSGHLKMRKLSSREVHRRVRSPGLATNQAPSTSTQVHQMYDFLHLVAALDADPTPLPPLLVVQTEEVEAAASKFTPPLRHPPSIVHHPPSTTHDPSSTVPSPLVLALAPGAQYGPAKRWPLERFIAAAREVQARLNCLWLILGAKADATRAEAIHTALQSSPASSAVRHPPSVNLTGQTTLRELMALLKLSRVLLTNDSGPMHLAAALGTPVVVPFGSTSPELTGPGLPGEGCHRLLRAAVPCSPCFRRTCPIDFRCMTGIGVEAVVEAVIESPGLRGTSYPG